MKQFYRSLRISRHKKLPTRFGNYEVLKPNLLAKFIAPTSIPKYIKKPNYDQIEKINDDDPIYINNNIEIEGMREACQLAREILEIGIENIAEGMTTEELDKFIHNEIIKSGAYPSPLAYKGFPRSCCTSINNVMCHGIPDSRPLRNGDIMNIDITVYYNGFHGDTSQTIGIGDVDSPGQKLIETTKEALNIGISAVQPGVPFNFIGNAINKFSNSNGYTVAKVFCGHGIGSVFHRAPLILHHSNHDQRIMTPGMIFTIEPVLCQGSDQFEIWPDGWTAASVDGGRSAQFEHTILVTESGHEILTV